MNEFVRFAIRLHKMKIGMQDLAEQELAKVRRVESIEQEKLNDIIVEQRRAGQHLAAVQNSPREWQAWAKYGEALASKLDSQQGRLEICRNQVEQQKTIVIEAHRDRKRWETIVEQHKVRRHLEEQAQEVRDADESAVVRYGRSQS